MKIYFHHVMPCGRTPIHGIWHFAEKLSVELAGEAAINVGFSYWSQRNTAGHGNMRYPLGIAETRKILGGKKREGIAVSLLLHFDYGSYGWADLPIWLPLLVASLKQATPGLKVGIFCHEIPPLAARRRRDFFLLPPSRLLFGKLLRLCDQIYCSNPFALEQVRKLGGKNLPASWHPVFSNIGEPIDFGFLSLKNLKTWVVFGSPGNLPRYLRSLLDNYRRFPKEIFPEIVHVIGGGDDPVVKNEVSFLRQVIPEVKHHAAASEEECSAIFRESTFCYLRYFAENEPLHPELLLKSGVFAAANAHGVVTICDNLGSNLFLQRTSHPGSIWKDPDGWTKTADVSLLSHCIFNWYRRESSCKNLARVIASDLFPNVH